METKKKKKTVFKYARELYGKLITICYNDYNNITDKEKKLMGEIYKHKNLILEGQITVGKNYYRKSKN